MARVSRFGWMTLPLVLTVSVRAADLPVDGTWKVSYYSSPSAEITNWIVKLETRNGSVTGSLVATNPRIADSSLTQTNVSGDRIRLVFKAAGNEYAFDGHLPGKEKESIGGVFDDDRRVYIAHLARTDQSKLEASDIVTRHELPEPMQQANELSTKPMMLRAKAQQEKDPDAKKKLLEQASEATKAMQTELPKLYEKVVANHADDIAVFDAGMNLLRGAAKNKTNAEQVKQWADALAKAAAANGPLWHKELLAQIADVLAPHRDYAVITLEFAQRGEKLLQTTDPASRQGRVLKGLAAAQGFAGKADAARQTHARLEKIEEVLDKEYFTKVPPLKTEAFAGRKNPGDRAVVMELFTGAQCPPCVAADVAFDALGTAYRPSELILIQYHLHIPGPDPLTNADSEARWEMYRGAFPKEARGTPTTLFNGKPQAGGGGLLTNAANKLRDYRAIIDPLVEEPAGAMLKATAVASAPGQVQIKVEVADVKAPAENLRLCVLLVEENVRYVGGNKLRFHHYVVRSIPTGADGAPLPPKGQSYTTTVNLNELRNKLTKYLDEYADKTRPFPNMDRPMHFKNLRAIAFVQDDKTREIHQGTAVDVTAQSAKR